MKKASIIDEKWSVPYYNLGLIYKYQNDWHNSLNYNKKAVDLAPRDPASIWNLGIAATALREWKTAKAAWKNFGIEMPDNTNDELFMDIGITPIRLIENSEVVWAKRIDPARAVIENIPTKESKRRYKDIILHDSAPNGTRENNKIEYPVFDELELFEPSSYQTYKMWVKTNEERLINVLEETCEEYHFGFENWTTGIRYLCKQCSEGKPHEEHDHDIEEKVIDGNFEIAIALTSKISLDNILKNWVSQTNSQILEIERII